MSSLEIQELLANPELSSNSLQLYDPVAWITEWVQRYSDGTPIIGRRVSFTKGNAPSSVPNHIPLYTSPQKREPLSDEDIRVIINQLPTEVDLDTGIELCRIIDTHWSR
jgi:hypothetical protein